MNAEFGMRIAKYVGLKNYQPIAQGGTAVP